VKFKRLTATIVLAALLCCSFSSALALSTTQQPIQTFSAYEYPVKPGTDEWEELETFQRRLAVCRIPQDKLDMMSSGELVDAVLNFPFLLNILIYEDITTGFSCLMSQCDALRELLSRGDGANALADKYIEHTSKIGTRNSTLTADSSVDILYPMFLEAILGQPDVYNAMNYSHQHSLETAVSNYNLGTTSYLDISISENAESITRANDDFYVETPNGSPVAAFDFSNVSDFTSSEKQAMNDLVANTYSYISRIRNPSKCYNCHSYAWHSTSTTNKVWINNPSAYMSDGSYAKRTSAAVGYKVFYDNPGTEMSDATGDLIIGDHSGIIYSISGNSVVVISKWGPYGLYTHYIYNSPYSGDDTEYSYWF